MHFLQQSVYTSSYLIVNEYLLFYTGLSLLTVHELDAIRCKEWRILPVFSSLNDRIGFMTFALLHVPLFLWVFTELNQNPIDDSFRVGFDIFMLVHVGLHLLLLRHKHNEFKDVLSWLLIVGAGLFGLLDLLS